MKVTLINQCDSGGGAAAAGYRLFTALRDAGVEARLLVQHRTRDQAHISGIADTLPGKLTAKWNFLAERLPFIMQERDPSVRFAFSTARTGSSIAEHPWVKDADLLHLHWTNSGFLSIPNLKELFSLQKPIVWTLHDQWAFTGGCHYSEGCDHFLATCGNCPMLKKPGTADLSAIGWRNKEALFNRASRLTFVTCSNWLKDTAAKSGLLGTAEVIAIPNPIDTNVFRPGDRGAARKRWTFNEHEKIILFGAANIAHTRKGTAYLLEALRSLGKRYGEHSLTRVVIFGKAKGFDLGPLPFAVTQLPLIRSEQELVSLYTAADVFVQPSLEDNLPNMVMEALACGTPVAAFRTGGLPDLVDHRENGYLATLRDADDLADGIHWVLSADRGALSISAREKVLDRFTGAKVALAYNQLYQKWMR